MVRDQLNLVSQTRGRSRQIRGDVYWTARLDRLEVRTTKYGRVSLISKSRVSKEQKTACLVTEREQNKVLNSGSSVDNDKRSLLLGVSSIIGGSLKR